MDCGFFAGRYLARLSPLPLFSPKLSAIFVTIIRNVCHLRAGWLWRDKKVRHKLKKLATTAAGP
jgi:hypothetical protein